MPKEPRITVLFEPDVYADIEELARRDKRKKAQMVRVLVDEAIARRRKIETARIRRREARGAHSSDRS